MDLSTSRAARQRVRGARQRVRGARQRVRGARHLAFALLLGAIVLLAAAPAAMAGASAFTGGPIAADTPTVIANDHTVYALRLSATGGSGSAFLLANTTYYVKVRFTPNADGSPAGVDNRGFNWNPAGSGTWVQERATWENFTTVTTDGTGAIAASPWIAFKFGDTTKTGTYRILISLSTGGSGATRNGNVTIPVTVIQPVPNLTDPTANMAWVHDGVATGQAGGTRAVVIDHNVPATTVAAQTTEANGCDDDGDGAIDNEVYGPVQAGGFRMAVPTERALDVTLNGSLWSAPGGFTIAADEADTDIALGATDQLPPSAPGTLTVAPRNNGAALSWGASTDPAGSTPAETTGVTAYNVYRWTAAPVGEGYTAMPVKVGTATGSTTFADSGLTNGTQYFYLVRAVDAATNVGPRSNTASATPEGTPPASVALIATPGDGTVALAWNKPADSDFAGVKILRKVGSAPSGVDDAGADVVYDGTGTTTDDNGVANGTHYYYAAYSYDTALNYAAPGTADATPMTGSSPTIHGSAAVVSWGGAWVMSGTLASTGGDPINDADVTLQKTTTGGAPWTDVQVVHAVAGTATYSAVIPAPLEKTQYRLTYAGDAGHTAGQSTPITVTPRVKLGKPVAPTSVFVRHAFTVYGSLVPKQVAGTQTVVIKGYIRSSGRWVYKGKVVATNVDATGGSRYKAGIKLLKAGSWKLVAFSAKTAKYAATTSAAEFLKVR